MRFIIIPAGGVKPDFTLSGRAWVSTLFLFAAMSQAKMMDARSMTIRRKLQLVYVLILLSTVGIGVLAVWSVASWHQASMDLTYSHVQGERVERIRGDIYRQVKEVVDWLTLEDKDADEEFRSLAVGHK